MAGTLETRDVSTFTTQTPTSDVTARADSQGLEAAKDVAFGSIAGAIGKVIEYPFDTIKVRLQSQPHPPIYSGPYDCFRQSLLSPEGGFRSLYRGISAPLFGAGIETGSLFFSYRIAQTALQALVPSLPQGNGDKLPLEALLACGAMSGAATSLLLTPIELVKCKLQYPVTIVTDNVNHSHNRRGPLSVIASVFRNHGILGFWRGQLGTLIRETGGSAAWFGSYEAVSIILRNRRLQAQHPEAEPNTNNNISSTTPSPSPLHHQLLAGASAGIAYNFIFFPADTIKSRMQTEDLGTPSSAQHGGEEKKKKKKQVPSTFWRSGAELWRRQGLQGLYRGCGITVLRSAPSSAVIFAIYEGLRGWAG
ncbi:MAG: hypothetical protein Q9182_005070 [Xanthomendoza sp. 2 TL-2023]